VLLIVGTGHSGTKVNKLMGQKFYSPKKPQAIAGKEKKLEKVGSQAAVKKGHEARISTGKTKG